MKLSQEEKSFIHSTDLLFCNQKILFFLTVKLDVFSVSRDCPEFGGHPTRKQKRRFVLVRMGFGFFRLQWKCAESKKEREKALASPTYTQSKATKPWNPPTHQLHIQNGFHDLHHTHISWNGSHISDPAVNHVDRRCSLIHAWWPLAAKPADWTTISLFTPSSEQHFFDFCLSVQLTAQPTLFSHYLPLHRSPAPLQLMELITDK